MGSVITIQATGAGGSEDALASIDIPQDGAIVGIQWAAYADFDADAEAFQAQVGFGSDFNNSNDSRNIISSLALRASIPVSASGMLLVGENVYFPLPLMPVGAGERIFLHLLATAGVTSVVVVHLHLDFNEGRPSVRRR